MLINNYEMGKTNSVGASRTLDERIIGTSRLEAIICANLSETELRKCQERTWKSERKNQNTKIFNREGLNLHPPFTILLHQPLSHPATVESDSQLR
uniref:Uncharacterized protein n=1 Tax=Caenorhabditis japonica TaxID=281687 RepID=A0A8R1I2L2_CAEJA